MQFSAHTVPTTLDSLLWAYPASTSVPLSCSVHTVAHHLTDLVQLLTIGRGLPGQCVLLPHGDLLEGSRAWDLGALPGGSVCLPGARVDKPTLGPPVSPETFPKGTLAWSQRCSQKVTQTPVPPSWSTIIVTVSPSWEGGTVFPSTLWALSFPLRLGRGRAPGRGWWWGDCGVSPGVFWGSVGWGANEGESQLERERKSKRERMQGRESE